MKRTLAALSAAAVVGGLLVASGPSQPAEASVTPPVFALDCTNNTTLKSSLEALANSTPSQVRRFPAAPAAVTDSTVWVFSGLSVGGSLTIENTATRPTDPSSGRTCRVEPGLGGTRSVEFRGADAGGPNVVVADQGGTYTVDVRQSGVFTVAGTFGPTQPDIAPVQIRVDACSLAGSGIELDPWRVGTLANLETVGQSTATSSCLLSGHYLQTATISDVDTYANSGAAVVDGTFTGTYDGDHYGILYTSPGGSQGRWEDRPPLFETLGVGGVIKRLSLGGLIKVDRGHDTREISGLVGRLDGGLISEVGSSVNIDAKGPNPIIGGLVAIAGDSSNTSQRIQYSSFGGRLDWTEDPNPNPDFTLPNGPSIALVGGPTIGGLVGMAEGETSATEIRDSYSRAEISFDSSRLDGSNSVTAIYAGGLIGSDGLNGFDTTTFERTHSPSSVRIVRSYFAGSFSNTCPSTTASVCNTDNPSHVFLGGFMGVSEDLDDAGDGLISAFSLSMSGVPAVGEIVDGGNAPSQYTDAGFPQAARLSTTLLRTLSTYQSEEEIVDTVGTDQPSGNSDLLNAASAAGGSTLSEQDYRWAIEAGNVETFVASGYVTEGNYLTRTLFDPTSAERSYRREGAGDLTVHGGSDDLTVTGYPSLGRVWEICPGNYPVLVWEERDCADGGGGDSGSRDRTSEADVSEAQLSEALAAGLSGAELAAFLASGLTLEQWMAQRLAATGTPAQMLAQGLLFGSLLALTGLGLVFGRRRLRFGNAQ